MAYMYFLQGEKEKALNIYERALEIAEKRVGDDHELTVTIKKHISTIISNSSE